MSEHSVERDDLTGVATTGHEWDGLKELNNPAPRWWLWIFIITVVWSVGYMIVYPALVTPRGKTSGTFNWSSYGELKESQGKIDSIRGVALSKVNASTLEEIVADPELKRFAIAGGNAAFKENCAPCHGTGAEGSIGYPNLNDDDWIWGGTLGDIYHTLKVGIRSAHEETRTNAMPNYGADDLLTDAQISQVADYVLALPKGEAAAAMPGAAVFAEQCASCHGDAGIGNREMGGPRLDDAIWLYGGKRADIVRQLERSRAGVMPTWQARMPDSTIKQLAVYVHSLGGGE